MITKSSFLQRLVDMASLRPVKCDNGTFRAELGQLDPEELLKLVFQEMQARVDSQPASYEEVFRQFQRELFGQIITLTARKSIPGR